MAQVVDTEKNSTNSDDDSVSVLNPAFNIEIDKKVRTTQVDENEKPLVPKKEKKKQNKKKRIRRSNINYEAEVTCRKTCGWQVIAIGLLILSVSAFHIVIIVLLLNNGKTFDDRPAVSIFLVFSILFILVILLFLKKWKKRVKNWVSKKFGSSSGTSSRRSGRGALGYYRWYIDNCGLDGKYYLWRLFGYEIVEHIIQFKNLVEIYSCSLPLGMNVFICAVLGGEAGYRAWLFKDSLFSNHKVSVSERNCQVTLDIVIDLFFLICPLAIIFLAYNIPLTVDECLWLTVSPTYSLFNKLKRMIEECMRRSTERHIIRKQDQVAKEIGKKRRDIFKRNHSITIERMQNAIFPVKAKRMVFVASFLYAILMFSVAVYQLAAYGDANRSCNGQFGNLLWKNGCELKVPFCQSLFDPKCNCAVFELVNHNESKLPEKFVGWTALRRVEIDNGPLEELPNDFMNLKNLARLRIRNSKLKSFYVDIAGWENLIFLNLEYNNIKKIHPSILKSKSLVNLNVASNVNFSLFEKLAEDDIYMPSLNALLITNNSASVSMKLIGMKQFPKLMVLLMDRNKVIFHDNFMSLSNTLESFSASGSNIAKLPTYMKNFEYLRRFDVRNNNISFVNFEFLHVLQRKNEKNSWFSEVLFANNPVCKDPVIGKKINTMFHEACIPLCSKYCWSRYVGGDGFCDLECNSKDCKYDSGDCGL